MTPLMSYIHRWGQYHRGAGDTFPQGIGSIAGYLEQQGIAVDALEPDVYGLTIDDLAPAIERGQYEIVGISAFTPQIAMAYDTARAIKALNPKIKIILGGSHPTIFPEQTLAECPEADYVIVREGEKPVLALIQALSQGGDVSRVPNLYYRRNGQVVSTGLETDWIDLDELPLFPYAKFDMSRYVPAPSLRTVLPTFNYMAQRGCPYLCTFCDTRTHGRVVRYRSVERVIDDLKELKAQFGIRGLIFEGSNFTANPGWVEELCHRLIEHRLGLKWYCMGRADLDTRLMPLMKRAGMWCMSFGIESANEKTLRRMKKHVSVDQVRETIAQAHKLRLRTIGSFILGFPGEDEADVLQTIRYASQLRLDVAVFFIPVPFPGTELYQDVLKTGGLKQDIQWRDYQAWLDHNNPLYVNPLLGERHVELYNYAFRRFYFRPGYLASQLLALRSWRDLKRSLQGFRSVRGLILRSLAGRFGRPYRSVRGGE